MKNPNCILFLVLTIFFQQLSAQSKYEFRGVWVATVENIDFPSSKFLSSEQQKNEFIKLVEMNKRNGMNALIVQIRPVSDAFYPSGYEPWSEYLSGVQGKPPSPYYDPLKFMITETHKRGMEFHAWMNPYRAEFRVGKSSISPLHVTKLHPDWFITYGHTKYFDPGNKDAQNFVVNVVRDVVKRYDIDAIHFDDYFYPYRISGKEFDDATSYAKYGNGLSRDAWRRSNVDSIILNLSKAIKEEDPYCQFGISPFGVWRNIDKDPDGSNTKAGVTNYDDLYADILLWLKMKWIDYVVPQLYWEVSQKVVGFKVLTDWWARHTYGRQLYIGQGIYRALESRSYAWKNKKELPDQIQFLRKYPEIQGSAFFSSSTFNSNPNGWNDSLKNNYYKYPAIPPPMPWIDSIKPDKPLFETNGSKSAFYTTSIDFYLHEKVIDDLINRYVIYQFNDLRNLDVNDPKNIKEIIVSGNNFYHFIFDNIPSSQNKIVIAATALTKTNNESAPSDYIYLERKNNGWQIINQSEHD
ncbi:MAG: family 10 glycosylhydrolase [Ginsengibacter sp.]